ncbi:hypothetical protein CFHF_14365 [Caulobacter flavus]|uniref:Uncharacterized protein n=1 Tax=Caulobacter flavus TaxID=1679497 RepID=A0A2N5CSC5_9CAUL|nr:hypothetical protein [Caulobacter flavus]AYV49048.1 hypothetical protein C1707_23880 [Caulobacter flavus]PLR13364.1 hypothetical protein CFHF_14365 [Caulobacter flavus]
MSALLAAFVLAQAASATPPSADARQAARDKAAEIVVVAVKHVGVPRGVRGRCSVAAEVVRAEPGVKLKVGAALRLSVPCAAPGASGSDVEHGVDKAALQRSSYGRAFFDERLKLIAYDLFDLN